MLCPNEACEGTIVVVGKGPQAVVMEYARIHDYYTCPWCQTEVWMAKKGKITSAQIQECMREDRVMQKQMATKGSSKKAGRKPRAKKMIPAPWWSR